MVTMADSTGTTTYAYDPLRRLLGKTDPGSLVQAYGYDLAGQCTKLVGPDGGIRTYTFDQGGRQTDYMDPAGPTTLAYDASARLVKRTRPSGRVTGLGYVAHDQVTSITETSPTGSLFQVTTYGYDPVGNRVNVNDSDGSLTTYVSADWGVARPQPSRHQSG